MGSSREEKQKKYDGIDQAAHDIGDESKTSPCLENFMGIGSKYREAGTSFDEAIQSVLEIKKQEKEKIMVQDPDNSS